MSTSAKRTTVSMITAGPDGTVFGVYRATVRDIGKRWSWNLHRARLVGTVQVKAGEARASYRHMAERFATAEYPAMDYPEER